MKPLLATKCEKKSNTKEMLVILKRGTDLHLLPDGLKLLLHKIITKLVSFQQLFPAQKIHVYIDFIVPDYIQRIFIIIFLLKL